MKKRSVRIAGHETSISLEEPFWDALKTEAKARGMSMNALVNQIETELDQNSESGNPSGANLSSAIRVFILKSLQGRL